MCSRTVSNMGFAFLFLRLASLSSNDYPRAFIPAASRVLFRLLIFSSFGLSHGAFFFLFVSATHCCRTFAHINQNFLLSCSALWWVVNSTISWFHPILYSPSENSRITAYTFNSHLSISPRISFRTFNMPGVVELTEIFINLRSNITRNPRHAATYRNSSTNANKLFRALSAVSNTGYVQNNSQWNVFFRVKCSNTGELSTFY